MTWNKGKTGLQSHSDETKKKLRDLNSGKNNPMFGREPWNKGKKTGPRSEATKQKISETCAEKRGYDLAEYRQYRGRVTWLTELTYREYKDIINPDNHPRTRAGKDGYQIDHIESVKKCFDAGLPPEHCARLENLQMLPWKENRIKGC